jgi:hypothetical protein
VLDDGQVRLAASRNGVPPVIFLSDEYKLVDQIEVLGVPGLIGCDTLKISGPIRFAPGVVIEGEVEFKNTSTETKTVEPGVYKDQVVNL